MASHSRFRYTTGQQLKSQESLSIEVIWRFPKSKPISRSAGRLALRDIENCALSFINLPLKFLRMKSRRAAIRRVTKETRIGLKLNIDGKGKATINTGIPFFDHMLTLF